jgi:hypothetical protein
MADMVTAACMLSYWYCSHILKAIYIVCEIHVLLKLLYGH